MKKQVSEMQQPVQAGQVAKNIVKRTRRAAKAKKQEAVVAQETIEQHEDEQPTAQQPEEKKQKKVVDIRIAKNVMQHQTQSAILLIVTQDEQSTKIWLPKSQVNVVTDADDTDSLVVRIAGWLWYRQNLGTFFKAERWATEAVC